MKKEIDNIFVDVRNAFRLLSRYQKRILNIVNYIREQTPYTDMWGSKNWYSDEIKNRRNSPDKEYAKLHIPADTRSAFPVISVQSPVSIQCCWQS